MNAPNQLAREILSPELSQEGLGLYSGDQLLDRLANKRIAGHLPESALGIPELCLY
jgi:hypothetical protein